MSTKYHQISLKESFSDCQDQFIYDAPSFFVLLSEYCDINVFIPIEFFNAFYQSLSRIRIYPLQGFLSAFILQKIFSIPTDSLLLLFLNICKELRQFCGFPKVPDASLAGMLTFDTSGIELYVTENNPKTLNALIKKLKIYYIAVVTNGLGIVRHISFIDDEFKSSHPELMFEKKTDSPDEDKSIGDASSLVPVLSNFFTIHPDFHPTVFLGDSAFDPADLYGILFHDFCFSKALIPYNPRNESPLKKVGYNVYGYPTCPNDSSLDMKYCSVTKEKGRVDRVKWICPKMAYSHGWHCNCENPCNSTAKGRTTYTYENMDSRMFPESNAIRMNGTIPTK